ncbi:MAG: carboxymuconolactone decarboxylase family protein [Promethearchaeota archaeon]
MKRQARKFEKRVYTMREAVTDIAVVAREFPRIREAFKSGRVGRGFGERIMNAVTAVNGCRYCTWLHAKMALENGTPEEDLLKIYANDVKSCSEDEVVALAFAQHYAESGCRPSREATKRLVACYGLEKARDVLTYIRLITIGNLLGNTYDGFLSRLRGAPAPGGSLLLEVIAAPFGYLVGLMIKFASRKARDRGGEASLFRKVASTNASLRDLPALTR